MNEIKKRNTASLFFIIEYFICFLMIYGVLWNKQSITSGAFVVSFITLFGEFIVTCFKVKDSKMVSQVVAIAIVSLICVSISYIHNDKPVEFDTLKEYIIFLTAIIFMFLCCYIETTKKSIDFILKFNIIIGYIYYIAYLFAPKVNDFSVGLDFNFGNPNFAGMWLLQSLLYCTLAFIIYKKPIMRIFSGIPIALLFHLISKTGARNCILAYALFAAVCIWFFAKKRYIFPKAVVVIINILPIVFVPVYLKFIGPIKRLGWFNFLVSEGKNLDSRVKIWTHFLDKLGNRWLIGDYLTCYGNSHNSHMVVLCSYGFVTLLLVILFTYTVSMTANSTSRDKRSGYCLAAFFATLFMGFGEGALFAGGIGLYIMGCSYIYLARFDFSEFDVIEEGSIGARAQNPYNNRLARQQKGKLM